MSRPPGRLALIGSAAQAVCVCLILAGCGGGGGGASTAEEPQDRLEITRSDDSGQAVRYTLDCASGDRELCAEIARLLPALVPDPEEICSEVYGGAETITISGILGGTELELRVGRANGCAIDRYDRLDEVLSP